MKLKKMFIICLALCALGGGFAHADTLDWKVKGYVKCSFFPINDEHETPATLKAYIQGHPKKLKTFLFVNPVFYVTDNVPQRVRHDNTYITTGIEWHGVGYLSDIQGGIGYQFTDNLDVRLIYRNTRYPNGYEGDWTGIQLKWSFEN